VRGLGEGRGAKSREEQATRGTAPLGFLGLSLLFFSCSALHRPRAPVL
jgi:hypothetical protein